MTGQDCGDGLRKVAEQAGIKLYASSTDLAGRTTRPLKGDITPREAIETLLRGTGLTPRFERGSVIILGRAQSESSPAQEDIVVTGSRIRSEEHTSELQSLMRISYAVFCLKQKKPQIQPTTDQHKNKVK